MELAIIIGVVVILFVVFILASYIKAPTDRALIVSGLRKNPKFVIGKSALRIPFLQRVDKLELKMISVDVKTKESVPTNEYINVNILFRTERCLLRRYRKMLLRIWREWVLK